MDGESIRAKLARRFDGQARACADLGSPLYAALLGRAAADIAAGGPIWAVIAGHAHLPGGALVSLRLMGATHRLALDGRAPRLAAHYPSCGGDGDAHGAWVELRALCEERGDTIAEMLDRGVQTNEVGRAGALLGGFLDVARSTGLPLRLLEVGASAGLNLRWPEFRYAAGPATWGPADSPVDIGDPFVGAYPDLVPHSVAVAERRGCDLAPIDPTSDDGRLTLASFVWPDMVRRRELLDGACSLAPTVPAAVDRETADAWLGRHLEARVPDVATVIYHSVVLQYVEPGARARMLAAVDAAGRRATPAAPLAWLRLEPAGSLGPSDMEVRLSLWPGGTDRCLAMAHPQGIWVDWRG